MDTLVSRLLAHAAVRPEAPAYIDASGALGYAMLCERMRAAAAWLHHRGVRAGEVVALPLDAAAMDARRALWLYFGLARLGAVVLPFNSGVPPARRAELCAAFGARWSLWADARPAAFLDASAFEASLSAWLGRDAPGDGDPRRPFLYFFTSGTTGAPKACLFTAGQFAASRQAAATAFGSSAADRIAPPRLWPDTVALNLMGRIHCSGGALANVPLPDAPQALCETLLRYGISEVRLSPFQLRVLMRNAARQPGEPLPLRFLYAAGGSVSPHEVSEARRLLTPAFGLDYGSNEMGNAALLRPEDAPHPPGLVGRLNPGLAAQAVDDADRPLPPGAIGRLRFRAPWIARAYAGNDAASAERFRDGWFYPADAGSVDAQGRVILAGRLDDIVNYGGVKLAPADIEAVVLQHPDVEDCAVVGVPDSMSGEIAVAFVVLGRPLGASELRAFCAQRMDASRIPRVFRAVSSLARNPQGKLLRQVMRDAFVAERSQRRDR
ncbi:MAG: acyl--CoA ligase [Burkholderiales bacterium]|nr:acyl--CoA ligase [Burkholderiales bacterium]